ncbi:GNAT family N-acetyltransferase [Dongshaea marina]|uniref:GNAT family N-acetyltransferase n=1 Tax=Dongshaea marina TaxID=2047966 RepID=UPI000D3EBCFE|nr:GNAT family N-acetyltransferase [Dongshaea marina]
MGENLPRSRLDIFQTLDNFVVSTTCDHQLTGCASLHLYHARLAEIRSLGINPKWHGEGHGTALIKHLLSKAQQLDVEEVLVLTRAPGFFEKLGFERVSKSDYPKKIDKDCQHCPRRDCCDETALRIRFD